MENLAKIGIDWWGMLLYAVNYGLLLFVLAYFLYPKLKSVIKERRVTIKRNLESAEKLRLQLEDMSKENEREKNSLIKDIQLERTNMQKEMQEKKTLLAKEMEEAKNKMVEDARAQIEEEKKALITETEKKIVSMIEKVILSILSNKVPENVIQESVEASWDAQKKSL